MGEVPDPYGTARRPFRRHKTQCKLPCASSQLLQSRMQHTFFVHAAGTRLGGAKPSIHNPKYLAVRPSVSPAQLSGLFSACTHERAVKL